MGWGTLPRVLRLDGLTLHRSDAGLLADYQGRGVFLSQQQWIFVTAMMAARGEVVSWDRLAAFLAKPGRPWVSRNHVAVVQHEALARLATIGCRLHIEQARGEGKRLIGVEAAE